MGMILFDWKTASTSKKVINKSFSMICLFDSYLTESTSYPHFGQGAYLTGKSLQVSKTYPNTLFSSISLLDGYLTEYKKMTAQKGFKVEIKPKPRSFAKAVDGLPKHREGKKLGKRNSSPKSESIKLVSLIRKVNGIDTNYTSFGRTIDKKLQDWIFAGTLKFTEEQMQWLRIIKDYVANSFHIDRDDFELSPFIANGGLTKMWNLFGEQTDEIINELNEALTA
jgi:hypothetical protein